MNNKPLLLGALAVLFLLKFIVVPVIEWQDEAVLETKNLQSKIDKSQSHIKDLPNLVKYKDQLEVSLTKAKETIERYNDASRYQISKQRQFEALFKEHQLTMSSSNWRDVVKTDNGSTFQLQVQFNGMLSDFIAFHLQVNAMGPSVVIGNLGLNIRGQSQASLGYMTGNMVIFFNPAESVDATI
ncbi:hypothetical protein Ssed_3022 [Shewanella sediminis HAW-EB3]|uniref:Type IV pilus biogenesis protein PilO n=1 Tax=Shewanella sediminis (strain HAW-EB3) TaxID=425104 RepID=A8FXQ3_SHESH|nr:hypothetical protein [Shewanella sediminis]ABV37626.1 hypothetical protein Ssed_3022 [Shewanella sediminis HAW-EB3]